jgi:hypothetical protein
MQVAEQRCLDHFVVVVRDLDSAAATYRKLGFQVTPPARHIELGSGNCIVHFADCYVELLCLNDALNSIRDQYAARLGLGEGLAHAALRSEDLMRDHRKMHAQDFRPGAIRSARRALSLPDGSRTETASEFFYMWRPSNPYLSLFFVQHHKPETNFIPEYERHINGVNAVSRVVYMSTAPRHDVEYFERAIGAPAQCVRDESFSIVGVRGEVAEVLSESKARERYGLELAVQACEPLQGLGGALHFTVSSISTCCTQLAMLGIAYRPFGKGVIVAAALACGCALVFEPR